MPEKLRSIFPFTHFNSMQSESFNAIYNTNDNCVISSPTGSGKTVLFEMAIVRLLEKKVKSNPSDKLLNSKILYMAPTKALCKERYEDWSSKFQPLNCSVGLLTGDSSFIELDSIKKSDLIICTPEKWDALTRKWSDYSKLLDLVNLLLIDEIHFLREKRGTSLEVVITRMMTISSSLRIIALSATVPNIGDVSKWLQSSFKDNNKSKTPTQTLVYDDSYRAVIVDKTVYGYKTAGTTNPFKFEGFLNGKLTEVIKNHSKNKPVLIFCPTRNSTILTAKFLSNEYLTASSQLHEIPKGINKELVELAKKGIAYHHAGLNLIERKFIENNFINGNIKILCSTSTLAVGVNLPAYLVIIKGTKVWNNNSMMEYNELDLMQMMGRAGRPQFETKGACVIMTDASQKDRYIRLVKGTENLESSLHLNIYENITAEITLKTITSLDTAFNWLKCTFFYQRFSKNPTAYPTIFSKANSHHSLDIQLKIFLKNILDELVQENMIEQVGNEFQSTSYGIAMSKSYVLYETIKNMVKSKSKLNLEESLLLVSESKEFKGLRVKMAEKKLFKEINNNPTISYHLDINIIENYYEKVSLLIQFELGGIEYPNYQGSMKLHHEFISEKLMIFKNIPRILKAAIEIYSHKKDAISLNSILKLNRCILAKSWEHSSLLFKQFDGIGLAYAKKLTTRGIKTIDDIKSLSRDKLEYYLGIKTGAGQKIMKSIQNMPELSLAVQNLKCNTNGVVSFTIKVCLLNDCSKISYIWNGSFTHINVLTDVSGMILDFRRLPLKKLVDEKSFNLKANLKYKNDYVKIYFNCDEIAGIGKMIALDVRNATECLEEKETENDENQKSFEFSDDEDVIDAIFGKVNKWNKKQSKPENCQNRVLIQEPFKTSSTLDTSTGSDSSFIECHHKCFNRDTCRHICCKEGIIKQKIKKCKHACKDKSKCRHMCCRDQFNYENKLREKQKRKKLKQDTLDFSRCISLSDKSNDTLNILNDKHKFANKETETTESIYNDCSFIGNPLESSDINIKSKMENKLQSKIPIFLKKIDKTKLSIQMEDTLEDYCDDKFETSRFFNREKKKRSRLLDSPLSDVFDETFDTAVENATRYQKKISLSLHEDENKKRKKDDILNKGIKNIRINAILPKMDKKNPKTNFDSVESVQDIVIVNQRLPKATKLTNVSINHENKMNKQSNNSGENIECFSIEDNTINTSINDLEISKEVFEFLDSDIEFD